MTGRLSNELILENVALMSILSVHSLLTVLHSSCVDNFG